MTKIQGKNTILSNDRTQGYRLAYQCLAGAQSLTLKAHPAALLHLAHKIISRILHRRQLSRQATCTGLVALRRGRHTQRLMRAFVVVDVPPGVKTSLHIN